jgi:hypothetical protein
VSAVTLTVLCFYDQSSSARTPWSDYVIDKSYSKYVIIIQVIRNNTMGDCVMLYYCVTAVFLWRSKNVLPLYNVILVRGIPIKGTLHYVEVICAVKQV